MIAPGGWPLAYALRGDAPRARIGRPPVLGGRQCKGTVMECAITGGTDAHWVVGPLAPLRGSELNVAMGITGERYQSGGGDG